MKMIESKFFVVFLFICRTCGQREVNQFPYFPRSSINFAELERGMRNDLLDLVEEERRELLDINQLLSHQRNTTFQYFQNLLQNLTLIEDNIEIECNTSRSGLWEKCRADFQGLCIGELEYLNRTDSLGSRDVPEFTQQTPPDGFAIFSDPERQKLWIHLKNKFTQHLRFFDSAQTSLRRTEKKFEIILRQRHQPVGRATTMSVNRIQTSNASVWFQERLSNLFHSQRRHKRQIRYKSHSSSWSNYNAINGSQVTHKKFFGTTNENGTIHNFTDRDSWLHRIINISSNNKQTIGLEIPVFPGIKRNASEPRVIFSAITPTLYNPEPIITNDHNLHTFSAMITDRNGTHHFTSQREYNDYIRGGKYFGGSNFARWFKQKQPEIKIPEIKIPVMPSLVPLTKRNVWTHSTNMRPRYHLVGPPVNPIATPPLASYRPAQFQPAPIFQPTPTTSRFHQRRVRPFSPVFPNRAFQAPVFPNPAFQVPVFPDPVIEEIHYYYATPVEVNFPSLQYFPSLRSQWKQSIRRRNRRRRSVSIEDDCLEVLYLGKFCRRYLQPDCADLDAQSKKFKSGLPLLSLLDQTLEKSRRTLEPRISKFNWVNTTNVNTTVLQLQNVIQNGEFFKIKFLLFGKHLFSSTHRRLGWSLSTKVQQALLLYKNQ